MNAKFVSVLMVAALMSGAAVAADKEMPKASMKEMPKASMKEMPKMPMMDMVKSMKADKDGMISVQQVMDMERARIEKKMKDMGMKGDKMSPAEWEKLYDQLYRGV